MACSRNEEPTKIMSDKEDSGVAIEVRRTVEDIIKLGNREALYNNNNSNKITEKVK